jgi:hypothetical protein
MGLVTVNRITKLNILAVKRVELVSDRILYITPKCQWCDDIVLNVNTETKYESDYTKDSFYKKLEHIFDQFPNYNMKILLEYFNEKVGREDNFTPTIKNESLH